MSTRYDHSKLNKAVEALKRASEAAFHATQYPRSETSPCLAQIAAAKAEIECAVSMIRQAGFSVTTVREVEAKPFQIGGAP